MTTTKISGKKYNNNYYYLGNAKMFIYSIIQMFIIVI